MPCCAFVACLIGQLLVAVGALKRLLFGGAGEAAEAPNAAVEWRLDSSAAARAIAPARRTWLRDPRARRGLAFAAALEILLILGAVYGWREHRGHSNDPQHARHHEHHSAGATVTKEIQP